MTAGARPDAAVGASPPTGGLLVVGFDGSAASARAVRWAIELARPVRGRLCLVFAHHANARLAEPRTEEEVDSPARAVAQAMRTLVREADAAGLSAETISEEGAPAEVLLRIARERSAVGIVVGTRGLGGAARLILGSVSARLVAVAPVPVTVVP
ncbi:MAG TPA: universal stress protein [Thermoplasmata archaeon]|nr:universal stress protein [Thermoplasmata archaeon]